MTRRSPVVRLTIVLILLFVLPACETLPTTQAQSVWNTAPLSLQVPFDVERLAVLYPKTYNRELMDAYARLESAAFLLKEQRPFLRIVERFDLPAIRVEQSFQLTGAVSDETAVSVGRLLGVDSVLFYLIQGPTVRDRVLAKLYGELAPYTVVSKIIRVESAEVVYHNVVTAPVVRGNESLSSFVSDFQQESSFRAALENGIARTIADLKHAFR